MVNQLDIIIFGATGVTGIYAVKHAARLCKEYKLTFGVAGRRKEALEAVIKEYAPDMDVPIIMADLENNESIIEMTKQAKVLVNCCGPYRFYGKEIVSACISTATHQVDVSAEPQCMEELYLAYHDRAKKAGIYIVNSCGIDSIPSDMGVIFAQDKFTGIINSIEIYLNSGITWTIPNGSYVNTGSWESFIYNATYRYKNQEIREKLYPGGYPKFYPMLQRRDIVHKSDISDGWSTIFPSADSSIIRRTQYFFYQKYNKRPIQVKTYMTFKSIIITMLFFVAYKLFLLFTSKKFTRNLLLKYSGIFTLGIVKNNTPKPKTMAGMELIFKSCGWTNVLCENRDIYKCPHKELITKCTTDGTIYDATCIPLILSAITILKESDKMPDKGGIYTPGAAFASTSLIQKLNKNSFKFEVVSSKENL